MINQPSLFKTALTEAELEFRRMCDSSPVLIWMSNVSGVHFFCNKAWRAFTGSVDVETTDVWFDKIHPEDRKTVEGRFKRHFAARTPYRAEYRLLRHDGSYRWIISHAAPYSDSHGRFAGFISSCFDFNDQHEFETTLATRALKQTALATFGRFALEQHSFADLTREAVRIILETLHVDCAYLASLDHTTHALLLEACACRLNKAPPRELGIINSSALTLTRAAQLADDPANFPLGPILVANDIRSALVCPVGAGKQLYGYLFANTRAVRTFSPEAIDFIQGLAITLSTVYQRERAEKALADSEQKLLQSQKVEAIGLLAGGIAHDFNNLLTAIRGYTELLQNDLVQLRAFAPARAVNSIGNYSTGIVNAADRAAKLVRQLLTFSRAHVSESEHTDLNALVLDFKELITAFLRSGIRLELSLPAEPVMAHVDRNQIEQVILNLAINARDAMPQGGKLTLSVSKVEFRDANHPTLEQGTYAQIAISDTGTGIPLEIQPRIFTPFFTTKTKDRGTGLGLPTCANIVKNSRGEICFDTVPGKGTTFIVWLPDFPAPQTGPQRTARATFFPENDATVAPAVLDVENVSPEAELPSGVETLLLVEDDSAIRDVATAILESLGYAVCAFATGEELMACFDKDKKSKRQDVTAAQLLITDMNMPGVSGRQLVERMLDLKPGLRVIYISGFVSEAVRQSKAHFLEKPFTRDVLAKKVREALDE